MFFELRLDCKLSIKRKNSYSSESSSFVDKSRFGFRLAFRRRHRRMAIAFYVPAEYGPPPPAHQQPHLEPVPVVDIHAQDVNNNNVIGNQNNNQQNNDNHGNDLMGLIAQFGREVMAALQFRNNGNQQRQLSSSGDNRHRLPIQSRRRAAAIQDNQSNAPENNNGLAVLDLLQLSSLPDIVTCHAGMSVRYGSSHPTVSQQELPSRESVPSSGGPQPLSPASRNAPVSMDFEVSLKLEVTTSRDDELIDDDVPHQLPPQDEYRLAGRQLRNIADNFQTQRARSPNQSTFELNVAVSVAVPTVAIIGLGLVYFRRGWIF